MAADGGRRRLPDDRRPDDVPRAAVGAEDRLGAVRPLFPERRAGAVLDPSSLSQGAARARRRGLRLHGRARGRVSRLQDRESAARSGRCRRGRAKRRRCSCSRPAMRISPRRVSIRSSRSWKSVRRDVVALGLPLRSVEIELGPSQCEFTFHPQVGLAPADTMMLFRSAVKQSCRRQGYHASFMCRPKLPNVMSSGWHLHQSLRERRRRCNAFMASERAAVAARASLPRRAARACARSGGIHDADDQRLQTLSRLCARARSRDLGATTIAA